jgi:hypothetical protein
LFRRNERGLELDIGLDEVSALLRCSDGYSSFSEALRSESGGDAQSNVGSKRREFEGRVQGMLMTYVALEESYLAWSLSKARANDTLCTETNTSSAIEDAFFLLQKVASQG